MQVLSAATHCYPQFYSKFSLEVIAWDILCFHGFTLANDSIMGAYLEMPIFHLISSIIQVNVIITFNLLFLVIEDKD